MVLYIWLARREGAGAGYDSHLLMTINKLKLDGVAHFSQAAGNVFPYIIVVHCVKENISAF
jgi:hypothetical protein